MILKPCQPAAFLADGGAPGQRPHGLLRVADGQVKDVAGQRLQACEAGSTRQARGCLWDRGHGSKPMPAAGEPARWTAIAADRNPGWSRMRSSGMIPRRQKLVDARSRSWNGRRRGTTFITPLGGCLRRT